MLAPLLKRIAERTAWRRMLGRRTGEHTPFAATARGGRGKVFGPLGVDLATATVNLVVLGHHMDVNILSLDVSLWSFSLSFTFMP